MISKYGGICALIALSEYRGSNKEVATTVSPHPIVAFQLKGLSGYFESYYFIVPSFSFWEQYTENWSIQKQLHIQRTLESHCACPEEGVGSKKSL